MRAIKKQQTKYTIKDIVIIAFFWLVAIALVYLVYLKIKLL